MYSSKNHGSVVSKNSLSSFIHESDAASDAVSRSVDEDHDLSTRKRKMSYTDKNGKVVDVIVDVPWGLDIGEEMDPFEESFGKRYLLKYNEKKEDRVRPIVTRTNRYTHKSVVVGANSGNKSGKRENNDGFVGSDSGFVGVEYGSDRKRRKYDDSDDEDIYDFVDLGCYGADGGGKLDFRENDEDYANLGDYGTMRGQIGDEEDVADEFREEDEHQEEQDREDLMLKLDMAIQRKKEQFVEAASENAKLLLSK